MKNMISILVGLVSLNSFAVQSVFNASCEGLSGNTFESLNEYSCCRSADMKAKQKLVFEEKTLRFTAGDTVQEFEYSCAGEEGVVTIISTGQSSQFYYNSKFGTILKDGIWYENAKGTNPGQTIEVKTVNDPRDKESGLRYSIRSDKSGVCVAQGFSGSVKGSAIAGKAKEHTVVVNIDGYITKERNGHSVSKIKCIE